MVKEKITGIDKNWKKDFLIGLVTGIIIIFIGFIIPGIGTIGIPDVPQSLSSDVSKFIVVVILASIFETFFFFAIVLSFFYDKLKRFGFNIPFLVAAIISSSIFAIFHLSAYGSFASASGAFTSAFIMGLVFSYQVKLTNSTLPAIISHSLINWWLVWGSLAIIT